MQLLQIYFANRGREKNVRQTAPLTSDEAAEKLYRYATTRY